MMAEPFIGAVHIFAFDFAPRGWAFCDGQVLQIAQNQALFSLLGTVYGGDGRTTFALPDLRARTPVHVGDGVAYGERGGEAAHTLNENEMPRHNHPMLAAPTAGDSVVPVASSLAEAPDLYGPPTKLVSMAQGMIGKAGGSQPHDNMQPYLAVNFCIALVGAYPSRN